MAYMPIGILSLIPRFRVRQALHAVFLDRPHWCLNRQCNMMQLGMAGGLGALSVRRPQPPISCVAYLAIPL